MSERFPSVMPSQRRGRVEPADFSPCSLAQQERAGRAGGVAVAELGAGRDRSCRRKQGHPTQPRKRQWSLDLRRVALLVRAGSEVASFRLVKAEKLASR
jgi:hypothetical protein